MSATAVALVGLCRAACIVLVDASGNFVDDLLNSWVGRIGEWLVLGAVMTAYAVHLRRQACAHCQTGAASAHVRGRYARIAMSARRKNVEHLPAPTRRPPRRLRRKDPATTRRARFA